MKKVVFFLMSALMAIAANAELTFSVGQLNYSAIGNGEVECTGFTSAALAQNPTTANIPGRVTYSGTEYRVYRIAAIAFKYCSSLKYVYVDWGIVEIGQQAFNGCSALYSVRLPSTLASIKENAFADCTSMRVFGIAATTPPTTTSTSFARMNKCDVHVSTSNARTAYVSNSTWTGIDSDGNVSRSPHLAHDFSESGRYYIIHTDRTESNYSGNATLIGVNESVTYIPITSVTDNMPVTYGGCTSGYTVNVTKIAPFACEHNTKLTSIGRHDLGAYTRFEEVGTSAFYGCTALTFACIPRGKIQENAFVGCTALAEVQLYSTYDLDNGVNTIYSRAFKGCTNLHEIMLTNSGVSVYVGGEFEGTPDDFKCYVPLKVYYNICNGIGMSSSDVQKMHAIIRPVNEWTPISCYRPIELPSNAEFYIVENVTTSGEFYIANKKRIIGNVAACTGMMMKATPGTIYRLNVASSGTYYASNKLKGVSGSYYTPETYTSNLYAYSNDYRYFRRWKSGSEASGRAYMQYNADGSELIYFDGIYEPYNLKVNTYQVTSENCGDLTVLNGVSGEQVAYNPSTHVLTLKNATISGGNVSINSNEGITINVTGTNTIKGIWLQGNWYDTSTITGGGTLNMFRPLYSGHNLTINGGTKVTITPTGTGYDYAIDHFGQSDNNHAYLTLEGSGTELRINSAKHLLRSTLTLNDGLYIAKPTGTSFSRFYWSNEGGVLVDAYGNELYNTSVFITGAPARGFKHNGLWYEQIATNTLQLIEPQRGDNYTGDVVIPYPLIKNNQVWSVTKIDTCAFMGTSVTSVDVPASVSSIDNKAFYGAKNLKTLVLNSDKLPNKYTLLGDNFVGNNASGFACYVKNSILLAWMQNYSSINLMPWVKTNDEGWLTFSCARHVNLPSELTAYRVSGFDTGRRMATTTKINTPNIPSKNGVILKGEPDTRFLLPTVSSAPALGDNWLHSFLTANDIPYEPYAANPDDTKAYFLANIGTSTKEWRLFQNDIDLFMALTGGIAYLAVDKTLLGGDYTSPVQLDLWTNTQEFLVGDLDNSGIIDVEDVNAAINIILKIKTMSDYPGNGDMDGNGYIDVEDVNAIINIILKL
ncbi:MAG: leucine-rich repeat protein [Muribaculaceae bacterium]|nr:leucine-rich repeat protein [Muribaculaceae bacterium]